MARKSTEERERQGQAFDLAGEQGGTVKTRIAFLATLGHLHTEPLKYDLACLRSLVQRVEPDLMGIEIEPAEWEQGCLSGAPVEVRDALVPAAAVTDTVVVPLGGPVPLEPAPGSVAGENRVGPGGPGGIGGSGLTTWGELRAGVLRAADRLLAGWQRDRAAQGPEAVNSRAFGHLCGLVCSLEEAIRGLKGQMR